MAAEGAGAGRRPIEADGAPPGRREEEVMNDATRRGGRRGAADAVARVDAIPRPAGGCSLESAPVCGLIHDDRRCALCLLLCGDDKPTHNCS